MGPVFPVMFGHPRRGRPFWSALRRAVAGGPSPSSCVVSWRLQPLVGGVPVAASDRRPLLPRALECSRRFCFPHFRFSVSHGPNVHHCRGLAQSVWSIIFRFVCALSAGRRCVTVWG